MADQLLTTALTWGIALAGFLLVLAALWLLLQGYRAARRACAWCCSKIQRRICA
jgi:hypothetical protein